MCPYRELVPDIAVSIATVGLQELAVDFVQEAAVVVVKATVVHMTIQEGQSGIAPGLHHPGHIASQNSLVVLMPPALCQGAVVLHFPRFSLRMQ